MAFSASLSRGGYFIRSISPLGRIFYPFYLTPDPQGGLLPGNEMEIGCALFIHQLKESVYLCHIGSLP